MYWIVHLTQANNAYRNDCGQACVAMCVNAVTGSSLTVDQVSRETNNTDNSFSSFNEMYAMLNHYGVKHEYAANASAEWWRLQCDAGRIGIALVDYRQFSDNPTHYKYAHFVVVGGFDGDEVLLFDPLKAFGPKRVPFEEFSRAVSTRSLVPNLKDPENPFRNNAFQGILITSEAPSMNGINIDLRHPLGKPTVDRLKGFGFVRFALNVTNGTGRWDVANAVEVYRPYIAALSAADIRVMVVLTHQTYGEHNTDWNTVNWDNFIRDWVPHVTEAAAAVFAGTQARNPIFQIWNEQDRKSEASVYVPSAQYGVMFREAKESIRTVFSTATVITGGYAGGPGEGSAHFKASGIEGVADGVAFHPYGALANDLIHDYGYGTIEGQMTDWRKLGKPLWMTEFGVLERSFEPVERVAAYASAMIAATPDVRGRAWYGWADTMHNGYGVVDGNNAIRPALFSALTAGTTPPATPLRPFVVDYVSGPLRVRTGPGTEYGIVTVLNVGTTLRDVTSNVQRDAANKWDWREIVLMDGTHAWCAPDAAGLKIKV